MIQTRRAFLSTTASLPLARGEKIASFTPGEAWHDEAGKTIQAHSAGILQHDGVYYWFGEDKTLGNFNKTGVSCYASKDLYNWKRMSTALPKEAMPAEFRDTGVCERAKVLYNRATRKFVMWMHLDDEKYHVASAGVAVAAKPEGPYVFLRKLRPVKYDFGAKPDDPNREAELGGTYRDMTLYQDDDGSAYAFYASENNKTMYIVRLNREFTGPEEPAVKGKTWDRALVDQLREAPAPFKHKGKYYLITSGCTGWVPNAATYAVADNVLGPYEQKGNPCTGKDADKTFYAQSTFVLPAPGKKPGNFIFLADRWLKDKLEDSRYVWLPFRMKDDGSFEIAWQDRWDLSWFDARK